MDIDVTATAWSTRAACAGMGPTESGDPDPFFPESGPDLSRDRKASAQAKRVCARCRVRVECLTWAMDENIPYGVFGGRSEEQRRKMRRATATKTARTIAAVA
jgi:WhiB family transcriptional regulator, redox-sensing transcriptional regulator